MIRLSFNQKVLLGALGAVALVAVLYVADRLASRADRIAHVRRTADLVSVRDAILQFQHEKGRLPTSLRDLVPHYLRADQLSADGRALFRYDPHRRTIALARPSPVQGIVSREIEPVSIDLPEPPPDARPRVAAARNESPRTAPRVGEPREPERAPPRVEPRPRDAEARPEPKPQPARKPPEPAAPPPPAAARSVPMTSLVHPTGPSLRPPPDGTFVFEAEHYSETNYGWEVHLDGTAAGGAYIHSKEGIANGPGQIGGRIANFYDVEENPEYTYLKYHFHLPVAGRYRIYGRFWTTGSHCSNCVVVGLDRNPLRSRRMGDGVGGYLSPSMSNRTPFRWVWTSAGGGPRYLKRGDHYLHLYLHEDGERLDQIALTTTYLRGDRPFAANLLTNANTAFRTKAHSQYQLTFDLKSVVMSKRLPPQASIAIRTIRPLEGRARVNAIMTDAGPDGGEVELGSWDVDLGALPELAFLPIDFSRLDFETLPRREFLLIARIASRGDEIASVRVPMIHPPRWEIAGPLPYYMNGMAGPLDVGAERDGIAWKLLDHTSYDHWGVIDFGVHAGKPSLHAPPRATAYARTRIHVPETGEYLLKVQSDDQMLLWIDDRLVLRHDLQAPVTRSVARPVVRIEKGDHDVRMRVNNREFTSYADGRWQASIRFRTEDDRLSNITGK